jgi:hypothetical protein
MKNRLIQIGQFTRILGDDNNISLTNILMIIAVIKFGFLKGASATDLVGAALAVVPYMHRRHFPGTPNDPTDNS